MNILLTSAGRRSYLVQYFMEALGSKGELHVANSIENSTAMKYGHKSVVTPLIYSKEYIPFLKKYCVENTIDVLVPLFDIDLPILSRNVKEFQKIGVRVIVSNEKVISICNDKWETFNYLNENGFNTPLTFLSVNEAVAAIQNGFMNFPLIVKPRWGMGSISIFEVENMSELKVLYKKIESNIKGSYLSYESKKSWDQCVIIQEKLIGQEYGLDIINDLESNYQVTITKKKLSMRSGETDCAKTVENKDLEFIGERLGRQLGHVGNLDTDAFIVNGIPYILEVNARFGGGYPFSHIAGVNLPVAILRWLSGDVVEASVLKAKIGITGYKDIAIIKDPINTASLIHS